MSAKQNYFKAILHSVKASEADGVKIRLELLEYESDAEPDAQPIARLWETAGFQFVNGFTTDKVPSVLKGLATAYVVLSLHQRVDEIVIEFPLDRATVKMINSCQDIVGSWYQHFHGRPVTRPQVVQLSSRGIKPNHDHINLDYNKVILGASGGKESVLNKMILDKAGYDVTEVTFAKSMVEVTPNTTIALYWQPDDSDTRLILPEVQGIDDLVFDPQGAISIPLFGLLAIAASSKGAGIFAVGTEFGMNRVWYPTDPDTPAELEGPVYDLACAESIHTCKVLEEYCAHYGLPVHVISPVGALHELGIVRALNDQGFNIEELESCWEANVLDTHYCGACLKCQRILSYVGTLDKMHPQAGWREKLSDLHDLGLASGSMLSYSMQYHLTEDHPTLPWSTAIIAEPASLEFLDHRTGNRILPVLVNEFGFKDTIHPSLYENKLELRALTKQQLHDKIDTYLGLSFRKVYDSYLPVSGNWLFLPFEEIIRMNWLGEAPKYMPPLLARVDEIELWDAEKEEWQWHSITGTKMQPVRFQLPSHTKTLPIMRLWLNKATLQKGLVYFNQPMIPV